MRMKKSVFIFFLYVFSIPSFGSKVYCDICKSLVQPLPDNTCPICHSSLASTSSSSEAGACALDPIETTTQQIGQMTLLGASGSFIPLDGGLVFFPDQQGSGQHEYSLTSDGCEHFEQIEKRLRGCFAKETIEPNDQVRDSNAKLQDIILDYFKEPTQDNLDTTVYDAGYEQVPFEEATFYDAYPQSLLGSIYSELGAEKPNVFLLIYYSETLGTVNFVSLTFLGDNIAVTLSNQSGSSAMQLNRNEQSINYLLRECFFLFQASEFYAYFRGMKGSI